MIPVRAFGQYGIRIVDPKKFLLKLVGTLPSFDVATMAEYFKGVFTTKIKTGIANAIIKNGKSVLEISTELEILSGLLKLALASEMDEYGVSLAQFNIHSINVPEDDTAVITLKAALARRTEMGLLGTNYQQQRSFDVLQTAAGNEGTAGSAMGAGMGMGMGVAMGGTMGGAFAQVTPQIQPAAGQLMCTKCNASNALGTRFCGSCGVVLATSDEIKHAVLTCDKCSASIPNGSKFCPNCADPVNACPACGEDNPSEAKQCRRCGKVMPVDCGNCKTAIPDGVKFCPECGTKMAASCKKCGIDLSAGAKFCNSCGEPQLTATGG